jgi:NAD(P)-dependent dehydrogenase (short-subunit alcohol dehydrogenase family)
MGTLDGSVSIVTGSTSGIGAAIAAALAKEGSRVVVSGRRSSEGERVVSAIRDAGGDARFIQADVSRVEDCRTLCRRTIESLGGVDILINNAGIFPMMSFEDTTEEAWDEIFAVNARAPFFCTQAVLPSMRLRGGGCVVNIGSTHPFIAGGNQFAYGCSKGTLHAMTRKLALLLAPDRIRVNWITVGWVLTEKELALQSAVDHGAAWLAEKERNLPMGRFTTEAEIASACAFLASPAGSGITGTDLGVSTGMHIHM